MSPASPPAARRGPGRPADETDRRGAILAAARTEFAGKGYDGASIRAIAARADVDPALVHHYFGSKEQVFVAAMAVPFDPSDVLLDVLAGDPAQLGSGWFGSSSRCGRTSAPASRCSPCSARR